MRHCITISTLLISVMSLSASAQEAENDTWLGVQLTPVPAALASHLQIEETGLMVRNIFKNSPADQAGILQYDVIIEADGNSVAPDVRAFSQHIRHKKPGEPLTLTIIRKGKKLDVTNVMLAKSPDDDDRKELKYPDDPDVVHQKNFGMRGRIMRPGPDGWVMEDLGDMPDADWFMHMGGRGWRDHDMDEARRVDNGEVLHVRRLKDGRIEVRRYRSGEAEDKGELKIYADMQELHKADPKAADLLESTRDTGARPPHPPLDRGNPRWQEWHDRFFQGPLSDERPRPPHEPPPPPPNVKFDVQPDGQIRVQTHQREAQLDTTFKSREEFKTRAPDLFKRFEDIEKTLH